MEDKIKQILCDSIDELNEQLDDDEQIAFDPSLRLIGSSSAMNSMTFVTFISIIEDLISDNLDLSVRLVNDKSFSAKNSPFFTLETLSNYIGELIATSEA